MHWEEVINPCNKGNSETTSSYLKQHLESEQEGVRYTYDKSEYAATEAGSLKRHIKSKP